MGSDGCAMMDSGESDTGDATFADLGYQKDGEEAASDRHCRQLSSLIGLDQPARANAANYTPEQVADIKDRIMEACQQRMALTSAATTAIEVRTICSI